MKLFGLPLRRSSTKHLLTTAAVSASIAAAAMSVSTASAEEGWYIPVEAVYTDEIDERFSAPGIGGAIGAGYRYSPNLAFEGTVLANNFDTSFDGGPEWSEVGIRLAANYYLVSGQFEPFITVGLSGTQTSLESDAFGEDDTTHAQADLGVGLDWNLTKAGTGIRAGVRYRVSFLDVPPLESNPNVEEDPAETQFLLGAKFALGEAAPPPPPPVVDADGDGVNDPLDACPNTKPNTKVDARGCIPDSDGDNVPDAQDKCPGTARGVAVDWTGCPRVMDGDKDGVPDKRDQCPRTKPGVKVYTNGCSVPETKTLGGVLFKYKSFALTDSAKAELDKLALQYGALMKEYAPLKLQVSGHTDSVGSDKYNVKLSQKRAKSVLDYLVSKGINKSRIISIGFGESKPVATNKTDAGRQQNRRVEIKLLGR